MVRRGGDAEDSRGGTWLKLVIELEDGVIIDVFSDMERPNLQVLIQDLDSEGLEEGAVGLSPGGYLLYSFPEAVRKYEVDALFEEHDSLYKED